MGDVAETSEHVVPEGSQGVGNVSENVYSDQRSTGSERFERFDKLKALCRILDPRGHRGEEIEPGDFGVDTERGSDGDDVKYSGEWFRMSGASSGARYDSKQVKPQSLAGRDKDQREW